MIQGGGLHVQHPRTAAIGGQELHVHFDGEQPHLDGIGRVGQDPPRQMREGVIGTSGIVAIVAQDLEDLLRPEDIDDRFEARGLALGRHLIAVAVGAAHRLVGRLRCGWREERTFQGGGQRRSLGLGWCFRGFEAQRLELNPFLRREGLPTFQLADQALVEGQELCEPPRLAGEEPKSTLSQERPGVPTAPRSSARSMPSQSIPPFRRHGDRGQYQWAMGHCPVIAWQDQTEDQQQGQSARQMRRAWGNAPECARIQGDRSVLLLLEIWQSPL